MNTTLAWCVVPPLAGPHAHLPPIGAPTTALQIAAFRARVLFDEGRRPSFRNDEGAYADADPLDALAFHVVVRCEGEIVGCIRVNPTSVSPPSSMAALLGPALLAHVMRSLHVDPSECWDGGRWAVDPRRQRAALGGELACAAMAVARHLGGRRLVGVAGVRQRQAERLVSLGAEYVVACPAVEAKALDDELRVVAFDLDQVRPASATRIEAVAVVLRRAWASPRGPGQKKGTTRPAPRGPTVT
jgi:N-acyl-L-homoserine lactone synthetase